MFCVFKVQIQSNIFVGGMSLGARITQTSRHNRQIEVMDKSVVWTGAAKHWLDLHRMTVDRLGCPDHKVDERVVGISAGGGFATQKGNLDI